MDSVMTLDAPMNTASPSVRRQQMPLTFMRAGEEGRVVKVRGKDEVHHHLENLGFVPGASLRVTAEQGGSLIIEIKGAQIALDRSAASKVIMN